MALLIVGFLHKQQNQIVAGKRIAGYLLRRKSCRDVPPANIQSSDEPAEVYLQEVSSTVFKRQGKQKEMATENIHNHP